MAKSRTTKRQREEQQAYDRDMRIAEREREHASRPLFGTGGTGKSVNKIPTLETPEYARAGEQLRSLITAKPFNQTVPVRYDDEMAIREAAAQVKIAEKRKRVAVVCHKSGYQYVGESEDPKTFGKKSQALDG